MTAVTQPPAFRSVCQLTGDRQQPTKFLAALDAADRHTAEVAELRAQLAVAEHDRDVARDSNADLATLLQAAYADIADLRARVFGETQR